MLPSGEVRQNYGLLTANKDGTKHWVIITGVSADEQWLRVYNPFANQTEYYMRQELSASRAAYGNSHLFIIGQINLIGVTS